MPPGLPPPGLRGPAVLLWSRPSGGAPLREPELTTADPRRLTRLALMSDGPEPVEGQEGGGRVSGLPDAQERLEVNAGPAGARAAGIVAGWHSRRVPGDVAQASIPLTREKSAAINKCKACC